MRSIILKLKYILFCLTLSLSPLNGMEAFAAPSAGIAATVNGEMISNLEIDKTVKQFLLSQNIKENSSKYSEMYDQVRAKVLQDMLNAKILFIEAKRQNIAVNDQELKQEIAQRIQSTGKSEKEFYSLLKKQGLSQKEFADKLRLELTSQRLINRNILRKIVVSQGEVLEFYQSKGGTVNGQVEVALIIYPSVHAALNHGDDLMKDADKFEEVAKTVSVGPNTDLGGNLGVLAMSDLAGPVQFQVQKLKPGEVSNVFSLGEQEAQVMLIRNIGGDVNISDVMDPAIYDQIENQLRQQKAGSKIAEYLDQLRDKAIINIK